MPSALGLLIEMTTKVRLVSYWQVGPSLALGYRAYVKLHYTCNYSLYIYYN